MNLTIHRDVNGVERVVEAGQLTISN